jgi:hypothetical protein
MLWIHSETSKRWSPEDGVWLVWWMKYQVFVPILLLQFLNLFWYYLVLRIAVRCALFPPYSEITSDNPIYIGPLPISRPQTIGRTTRMMTSRKKLMRKMIDA